MHRAAFLFQRVSIVMECSAAHMAPDMRPMHGPQVWPWWRLVSFGVVRLGVHAGRMTGARLWVYTRWGAMHASLFAVRRVMA